MPISTARKSVTAAVVVLSGLASGFYLPGIAPRYYKTGEEVSVLVNALQSTRSAIPFDFYEPRLHMCQPKELRSETESLGSVLLGDRLYNSPIQVAH